MAGSQAGIKKNRQSKLCISCNTVHPLGDFYPNKGWQAQLYHDVWCKECILKHCKDKESVQRYCQDNSRVWTEAMWETATKKAKYQLATNADYINPRASAKKKETIEQQVIAKQFFTIMNLPNYYSFSPEGAENGSMVSENAVTPKPKSADATNGEELHYSRTWRGYFTDDQVAALDDLYAQYEEDFVLDNVNIRDYARKVCKASLNADIMEDRVRRGAASNGDYKEAQKIFDDLSKSSNFAACRRKPGDSSGLGSLGEIVLRLEVSGALNENGFTFPEDDVDKIIKDFRHTLVAVGLEGQL